MTDNCSKGNNQALKGKDHPRKLCTHGFFNHAELSLLVNLSTGMTS